MSDADLRAFVEVVEADVFKRARLAATLRRVDGGVEFRYREEYLAGDGPAVATTLPRTEAPVRTAAGAVPPFFAGLLPEGRRLSALRRAVKTSADDELSLLLAVGSDVVGDVQVVPAGQRPEPVASAVEVRGDWSEVRFADLLDETGIVDRVGLPGVQDKVSARMISVPLARAGERYVLKLDPPEYPHVVEDEAYFLARARRAGLSAARAAVVHDADGRPGLLVLRFDRVSRPDGSTESLACEDACQVLGRWPADKYRVTSEEVAEVLAERCAARSVALRAVYQQLCFGWLTGNGDIHAKNVAILQEPDGEWRIAPAYDLPSTAPYGDRSMALSIGGETRGLSRRRLLAFGARIGLPERVALTILDRLLDDLSDLDDDLSAGALPFDRNTTIDLIRELRHRRRLAEG